MVVIGHQVLYPCLRGDAETRSEGRRSNDTGYRVFHKDSMKIARDFITGEMSVNKNEYTDGRSRREKERARENDGTGGGESAKSLSFYPPLALFLLDPSFLSIDSSLSLSLDGAGDSKV